MQPHSTKLIVNDTNSILYTYREIPRFQEKGKDSYLVWTLIPIAVYDYVDPDNSDVQGWLQEIPTTGNIDEESIVQYVMIESFEQSLAEFGYSFIDVSKIYIKNYNYEEEQAGYQSVFDAIANAKDLW